MITWFDLKNQSTLENDHENQGHERFQYLTNVASPQFHECPIINDE
jgi:hypothetical protein